MFAANGTLRELEALDVRGAIALLEMDHLVFPRLSFPVCLLEEKGALAVVVHNANSFAQEEGALHANELTFNPRIPVLSIRRQDAADLRRRMNLHDPFTAALRSSATRLDGAASANVVGHIPGDGREHRIIIGDHFDAWFTGFMDCAAGAATMLAMAKALLDSGYKPKHDLVFVAHGAEESGTWHSCFSWLWGAHQAMRQHPGWAGTTRAYLNLELLGYPSGQLLEIATTPELRGFIQDTAGRLSAIPGYPAGARVRVPPFGWSDDWVYAAAGIPTAVNWWGSEDPTGYAVNVYHTQFDDEEHFDPAKLEGTAQCFLALIVALDQAPLAPIDLGARLSHLLDAFPGGVPPGLAQAWGDLLVAWARFRVRASESLREGDEVALQAWEGVLLRAQAALQSGLMALTGEVPRYTCYPHEGLGEDLKALVQAWENARSGDLPGAAGALEGVRSLSWGRLLPYPAYRRVHVDAYRDTQASWGESRVVDYVDVHEEHSLARSGTGGPELLARLAPKIAKVKRDLRTAVRREQGVLEDTLEILRGSP
ncbi:MAG: M20/M25/M40 family metallo-hydrolase [Bacillota bacterium]